jgi:hypothetical protein
MKIPIRFRRRHPDVCPLQSLNADEFDNEHFR